MGIIMDVEFQSKNLTFRRLQEQDIDLFVSIYTDSKIMEFIAEPLSEQYARKAFNNYLKPWKFNSSNHLTMVICDKKTGAKIGLCGVFTCNLVSKQGNVGVMILEEFQSMGFGTEILTFFSNYCFKTIGYNKLIGPPVPDNIKCIRILEKSGYIKEATLRQNWFYDGQYVDTPLYTALRSEYANFYLIN